jgi:TonB family protein
MNKLFKIFIIFILLAFQAKLTAQQWIGPKPIMTGKLLKAFIDMHLEYPAQAQQNKEEGTVTIGFSVDEKGNIKERHILQSVSSSVDSSALHLFDLILWQPAEWYGKAVNCPATDNNAFPLKFNIRKYKKLIKKRAYDKLPQPYTPIDSSCKIYLTTQLDQPPVVIPDPEHATLNELIYNNISYPEEAAKLNISGVVRLAFVIETSGLPSNLIIKETVGGGCTEEAIGAVLQLRWTPGIRKGFAVRTQMELSVRFENPAHLKDKHIPNQQNSGI